VVRDDVDEHPEVVRLCRSDQRLEARPAASVLVDARRVDAVVAVRAPARRRQDRRDV